MNATGALMEVIMFTLWSDMDRLFNIFNDNDCRCRVSKCRPKFRMNLTDKGDNLEFIAELPGVSDKDVSLEIHNDTLTLSANRKLDQDKENVLYSSERGAWNIKRSISLPTAVEVENAKAVFKDGILRVTLPKAACNRPQRIAVNA